MNILYISSGYKPAYRIGGPVLVAADTAEALAKRGHRVVVFATNCNLDEDLDVPLNQPVEVDGVEVWYFSHKPLVRVPFPSIGYFSKSMGFLFSPDLRDHAASRIRDFDLVHTHAPYVHPTLAGAKTAIRHGIPLFFHQHAGFLPERLKYRSIKKRLYIKLFLLPILQKATTLIALTEAEYHSYRDLGLSTPCEIVPNGIDAGVYRQTPRMDLQESMGIRPEHRVILFMARLHPFKGPDFLLESFIQAAPEIPDAVLVLAGPDERGYASGLRKRVEDAGLGDRVHFPGMVTGDLKLDLLARADLFCLPSIAEGFSMAVLEALASGTPAMLSPGCSFPEVESRGAGVIVGRDKEAWVRSLIGRIQTPDALAEMGKRGAELIHADYTWDRITDKLERVYREGLKRNSP